MGIANRTLVQIVTRKEEEFLVLKARRFDMRAITGKGLAAFE